MKTNWNLFRELLNVQVNCKISLKTHEEVEIAIDTFNNIVQKAAWESTPVNYNTKNVKLCPVNVKTKIAEKRKLRKLWQKTRSPHDKTKLNKTTKQLKELINSEQNKAIEKYLANLTPTETTDYSLWKLTKKIKKSPQQLIPPIR